MEKLLTFMNYWLGKLCIPCGIPADKQMHFLSGAIIVSVLYPFIGWLSIIPITVIALLKEIYDYDHRNIHSPDIWDWIATALGGVTVLFIIHNVSYWG